MRAPPFLVAAALALWGVAFGHWVVAASIAIAIEASHWIGSRIAIERTGFRRLGQLMGIALVATLGSEMTHLALPVAMLGTLEWLPTILAVVVVPQVWGVAGRAPIAVLRLLRSAEGETTYADLSFPYVGLTLLAASGAAAPVQYFYLPLVAIAAWMLLAGQRGRRWTRWRDVQRYVPLFATAAALGFGIQTGLVVLQGRLEAESVEWLRDWMAERQPADRSRTRIGDLGPVKLSDRILMRVRIEDGLPPTMLIRDASFSRFQLGTWTNPSAAERRIAPEPGSGDFVLKADAGRGDPAIVISHSVRHRVTPLALPLGARRINGLPAEALYANDRGALRADVGAPHICYRVTVGGAAGDAPIDAAPGPDDLEIPRALLGVVNAAVIESAIEGVPQSRIPRQLQRFFGDKFRYSLNLGDREGVGRSLGAFLATDRAGHCEYFAAATVMLLRAVGIPARYATGYSVDEWSELEDQYVVRARHGHAWALAHIGGRWQEVDTTPADWANADAANLASRFGSIVDLYALLIERFDRWRAGDRSVPIVLPAAGGLLLGAILLRRNRFALRLRVQRGAMIRASRQGPETGPGSRGPERSTARLRRRSERSWTRIIAPGSARRRRWRRRR